MFYEPWTHFQISSTHISNIIHPGIRIWRHWTYTKTRIIREHPSRASTGHALPSRGAQRPLARVCSIIRLSWHGRIDSTGTVISKTREHDEHTITHQCGSIAILGRSRWTMVRELVSHRGDQKKEYGLILWQVFVPTPSRYAGARRTSLHLDKWIHNLDREAAGVSRSSSIDIWM